MQGSLPDSLEKEAHCCLGKRGEVTHPELLKKEGGETLDWGKREFPGSMYEGFFFYTL
jgi:hypothetical protein